MPSQDYVQDIHSLIDDYGSPKGNPIHLHNNAPTIDNSYGSPEAQVISSHQNNDISSDYYIYSHYSGINDIEPQSFPVKDHVLFDSDNDNAHVITSQSNIIDTDIKSVGIVLGADFANIDHDKPNIAQKPSSIVPDQKNPVKYTNNDHGALHNILNFPVFYGDLPKIKTSY